MKKILIIEDDLVLRENTAEYLKREGYQVYTAEDGLIGIQLTLLHLPDLILCDISMPNLDGFEYYKTIQQIKSTATIPLVFMTARTEKEDIRAGMQMGADDYLTKPFGFAELLKVVRTRLAKHEKIVKTSDEKFQALFDNPSIAVYIYQEGQIINYNKGMAGMFGFQVDGHVNILFESIVDERFRKSVFSDLEKCIKGVDGSMQTRFEAVNKLGERFSVEMYGTSINYRGSAGIIGNIVNLSKEPRDFLVEKNFMDSPDKLTKREADVLKLICKGLSTPDISKELYISPRTVDSHRGVIHMKTGCKNIAELVLFAIRNQIITMDEEFI